MKTIKTRNVTKNIKSLDKSTNLANSMKNSFVKAKERAEETQNSRHSAPNDYATSTAQEKAENMAHKVVNKIPDLQKNLSNKRNQKSQQTNEVAKHVKESAKTDKSSASAKNSPDVQNTSGEKAKSKVKQDNIKKHCVSKNAKSANVAPQSGNSRKGRSVISSKEKHYAKNIKRATKGFRRTPKGAIKTADKSVKSAKVAIKTARRTAKSAQKSAEATRRSMQVSLHMARMSRVLTKAAVLGVIRAVKLAILAVKKLVVAIVVGGKVAVAVVLVIVLIGGILGSVFGIFFSDEVDPDSGWTMSQAIAKIDMEFNDIVDNIISSNHHDILDVSGLRAAWRDVLAVYAVRTATDTYNPMDVATMNEEKHELLRAVFWDMNSINYHIEVDVAVEDVYDEYGNPTGEFVIITTYTLRIIINHTPINEITAQYGFTNEQMKWLEELLQPEFISLWNSLLFGVSSGGVGSMAMVEVAISQIGNVGGEIYWRWYGFNSRVPWCAIFVSWVAEQCGFIQPGIVPKFASTSVGVQWFQSRGLWQPRGYTPAPGDLIFFDWTGNGSPDHVGIVERVEGGVVYTIEGNSNDMVRRRTHQLNGATTLGYGVIVS